MGGIFGVGIWRIESPVETSANNKKQIERQLDPVEQNKDLYVKMAVVETRVDAIEKKLSFGLKTFMGITGAIFLGMCCVIWYMFKEKTGL